MNLLSTIVAFLVALTILIFIHELGHYLVARWCGVKVLRFSIGFGKTLFARHVGPDRTEWAISAIPLGGYVKMLDERETTTPIDPRDLPRAFTQQSVGKRAAIVAAGPLANFLLAIVLYWVVYVIGVQEPVPVIAPPVAESVAAHSGLLGGDRLMAVDGRTVRSWNEVRLRMLDGVIERRPIRFDVDRQGQPTSVEVPTASLPAGEVEKDFLHTMGIDLATGKVSIASIAPASPAAHADLKVGDQIVAVDGKPIRRAVEFIDLIRSSPGRSLVLDVLRGDADLSVPLTPESRPSDRPDEQGKTIGRIGAGLNNQVAMHVVSYGAGEAVVRSVAQTWDMSVFSLRMFGRMLIGELSWRNLSGPVTIADVVGQSARIGWFAYVSTMALISISLGVLNLLPIPVLDGGHLVYYGLEALRGKPLSERFMILTQKAGLAAIGALMVLALFNDITRLIG
ncbi:MAG: RIP metalloprotease RseP [Burkholderiaceae bacterium]